MAKGFPCLASFVHVSTAFVNVNRPSHSTAEEEIYPLMNGDQSVRTFAV